MAISCTGIFYSIVELRACALDISAKHCVSSSNFYSTNCGAFRLKFNGNDNLKDTKSQRRGIHLASIQPRTRPPKLASDGESVIGSVRNCCGTTQHEIN